MTLRPLRIRHYIGTVVAASAAGGLLLAFELAFLFQSLERRSVEQRERTATLSALESLQRSAERWVADVRASLDDGGRLEAVQQRLAGMLVSLEKLSDGAEDGTVGEELAFLRGRLEDLSEGARVMGSKVQPGHRLFEENRALVLATIDTIEPEIAECTGRLLAGVQSDVEQVSGDLERRRAELWRTLSFSAGAYAVLVLALWRWVAARLLRPLQVLTRESRRTLSGETSFDLEPAGPHEVRLLTQSLSVLVRNLVGARSHLEDKVKERTLELERANRAKNEFLANMSHEIRTPMTAILGYAELCLAPDIPETDRRRYAEIIHANGEHLLAVINDILDVSKIEAGRMTVDPTVCSPFRVVAEVRALNEMRAREKGLTLRVEVRGAIPEVVRTDPTRLRQILLNLVNNAIKFTDQGGIVLAFQMQGDAGGAERLVFEVQDTGSGLTREQLERVFSPFVQADTSTTRKHGGSGLGLTISRTLARLLGGDLTCSSEPGRGSSFRVTIDPGSLEGVRRLDHFPASEDGQHPEFAPSGQGTELRGRVLLVEDVAVNRRLISTILLRAGIRVDEAENGQVAVEKAMAARQGGQAYDIVFMDMQMPVLDGYEATRQLRQSGYMRPIVALTSHSMSGERQRCLEAGCDEYMTKPIDRLALLQVLTRFLPGDAAEELRAA
jgi:signal transduction histidine kinase/CheY-like chemotaxis protein